MMRTVLVALLLFATASAASAQGYTVTEKSGLVLPRPETAVRVEAQTFALGGGEATVKLPFRARYYGEWYADLVVSPYGWVLPRTPGTVFVAADPATSAYPFTGHSDGVISPLWNAAPASRIYAWTEGEAPARRFVLSWETGDADAPRRVVQLHVHEGPGRLAFAYGTVPTTGRSGRPATICGLDEPGGRRSVVPEVGESGRPSSDLLFEPRTVLFNPPHIDRKGIPVRWQDVRRESVIPDGCTKRCTYLARGKGFFHVPDRAFFAFDPRGVKRRLPGVAARLIDEDRTTFGGEKGDRARWVRQVLDGKMIFVPAKGGDPLRVWFRIVEYFTIDDGGTAGADYHVWNLRWMLSNTFAGKDARERIDGYSAWKAMATGRLTVGKLFSARQTDDAGRQFDSGRKNEYVLWSGRLKHGTRGALAKAATPTDGWRRFFLKEQDSNLAQHAEKDDLRFVADPNYVDGQYEYVIQTDANRYGWITGRGVPAPPLRDEGIDVDPGRPATPVTPR